FCGRIVGKTVFAVLQHHGIKIHEVRESFWDSVGHATDGHTGKTVADKNDLIQLFSQNELNKILYERVQCDGLGQQVCAVTHACEAGSENPMTGSAQPVSNRLPAPASVPRTVGKN